VLSRPELLAEGDETEILIRAAGGETRLSFRDKIARPNAKKAQCVLEVLEQGAENRRVFWERRE
jgi:hypothetical protein